MGEPAPHRLTFDQYPVLEEQHVAEAYAEQLLFSQTAASALSGYTDMMACMTGANDIAEMTPSDGQCLRNTARTLLARLELRDIAGKATDELYGVALESAGSGEH